METHYIPFQSRHIGLEMHNLFTHFILVIIFTLDLQGNRVIKHTASFSWTVHSDAQTWLWSRIIYLRTHLFPLTFDTLSSSSMDASWLLFVWDWTKKVIISRWCFVSASCFHSVVPANGCFLAFVQRPEHGVVSQACVNWELHLIW